MEGQYLKIRFYFIWTYSLPSYIIPSLGKVRDGVYMIEDNDRNNLNYCLYARKSSEQDERQAMSIESQVKEMINLAAKENIFIKEVKTESYSAKTSGTRSAFDKMIEDIKNGTFNAIITWAPDRLSRCKKNYLKSEHILRFFQIAQMKSFF